jgi:hypothetical protein
MSRKFNPFEEIFKSLTSEADTKDEKSFFSNFLNNEYIQGLKEEGSMNKVIDLISQMTPHLINSDILILILAAK